MKTIRTLHIIHPGFEEMEAVATIDLLVRAEVEVCLAGTAKETIVRGRNGIALQATQLFKEVRPDDLYDAVILPGGPGVKALRNDSHICELLQRHHAAGKILACICAAPLLLLDAGLLPDHYTAHPSTLSELPHPEKQDYVWHDRILTSKGAGTATQFALALIEALTDRATRTKIARSICWPES